MLIYIRLIWPLTCSTVNKWYYSFTGTGTGSGTGTVVLLLTHSSLTTNSKGTYVLIKMRILDYFISFGNKNGTIFYFC